MHLLAPFILQNLEKFLQQIQSYEDVPFAPRPKNFIHAYLHAKNQSQILIY